MRSLPNPSLSAPGEWTLLIRGDFHPSCYPREMEPWECKRRTQQKQKERAGLLGFFYSYTVTWGTVRLLRDLDLHKREAPWEFAEYTNTSIKSKQSTSSSAVINSDGFIVVLTCLAMGERERAQLVTTLYQISIVICCPSCWVSLGRVWPT